MKDKSNQPEKTQKLKKNSTKYFRARRDEDDANYKSTIGFSQSLIPEGCDADTLSQALDGVFNNIIGHRPIEAWGPPADTPLKRPLYAISPGQTKYYREKDYGFCLIFSNYEVKEFSRPEPDQNIEEWAYLLKPAPASCQKIQEIVVTPELLQKAAKDGCVRGKNGVPNQNTCLARLSAKAKEASAKKIATRLKISKPGELWEWLHLVAFFILRRQAQKCENLTGGTAFANTDMIFAEDLLFMEELGEVKLIVTSEELPGSHMSTKITYTIITPYFVLPFVFDPQTSVQPSLRNSSYLQGLVSTLLDKTQELLKGSDPSHKRKLDFTEEKLNLDSSAEKRPIKKPKMPLLFFSPPDTNKNSKTSDLENTTTIKLGKKG